MHYEALKQTWAEMTGPGSPFEVGRMDVRGQSLLGFKNAPPTVREVWLSTAQFADREYLIYQDERITYAEAHDIVRRIAGWLVRRACSRGTGWRSPCGTIRSGC
jgi:long-chain acyl-CoA synthetase